MGGSPPTALQAAEPLSPAGVEKGEEKHGPRPQKVSGEEEFAFYSYLQWQTPTGGAGGPSKSCRHCHLPAKQLDRSSRHPGACRRASPTFSWV